MTNLRTGERPDALGVYSSRCISAVAICFVLSGMTGLIYEVLWARMLGLVFGATTLAVSTVLASFMGGLALGSALAGRIAARLKRPLRAYGLVEIGIAIYALLIPWLFRLVDHVYALVWQQLHPNFYLFSLWRFVLSGITLLVPTTLMGATLPVLAAVLMRTRVFKSTSITRLYTYNLGGAILGTIAAGFFLLPMWGLRRTIYVAAITNILIGLFAIFLDRRNEADVNSAERADEIRAEPALPTDRASESAAVLDEGRIFWLSCAFVSGFVTISTQVAWTRVLTMVIGSSTYAFSIVVALFLVGLSLGAYEIGRKVRSGNLRRTIFKVEIATALALLLSLGVINQMPGLLVRAGLKSNVGTWGGLLALQIMCAALLILLPAILMGTVMPLVLVWASSARSGVSVRLVGRSYAVNTLGAILGAFCAGFILIPKTGTRFTILFAASLCFLVAGIAFPAIYPAKDRDVVRAFAVGGAVALILISFLVAPRLNLNELSIGAYDSLVRVLAKSREQGSESETPKPAGRHELLMYEEGPTSTVSVRRDWDITALAINGRTNASDGEDMATQVMLAQLPILLAPSIRNGLIVGFASGVSAGAILQSPIESVTCVELEPATVLASRFFEHVNNRPLNDPRLHLVIDDARTYLRGSREHYDLIMSEPSHPWVPGVANLFTEEFFELGRQRLNEGGVFVQWLQVYQLSNQSLRSVLATFHKVFPRVMVFRVGGNAQGKDLVLVGSQVPLTLDRIAERMRYPRIAAELSRVGMKTEAAVRAWYVCDETRLAPAIAGAVINTDDNMHVETTAPREAFLPLRQTNEAWIESLVERR